MKTNLDVRPSPIAGSWYYASAAALKRSTEQYLNEAQNPAISGEIVGIVAPHAGHRYSGAVAGHAFKPVMGCSYPRVVIVSPMHHYYRDQVLVSAHDAYETPLGKIMVDHAMLDAISQELMDDVAIALTPIRHDQEHSLEIELPFLQCALQGDFSLVPIMLRDQSARLSQALGKAIAEVCADFPALLVASSDLSHFFPLEQAKVLDQMVLNQVESFSPEALYRLHSHGYGHACGLAAIAAVMWASLNLGAENCTVLKYDTSAAVTGDDASVVGYGAAVFTRPINAALQA